MSVMKSNISIVKSGSAVLWIYELNMSEDSFAVHISIYCLRILIFTCSNKM
jgi:hypothetical protein